MSPAPVIAFGKDHGVRVQTGKERKPPRHLVIGSGTDLMPVAGAVVVAHMHFDAAFAREHVNHQRIVAAVAVRDDVQVREVERIWHAGTQKCPVFRPRRNEL